MINLRIALAQINPTVGDFAGNTARIIAAISRAKAAEADLVALPELSITGYPPRISCSSRNSSRQTSEH
jgi:NAD+ synthase (glutamine-hydrolysing)